MQIIYRNTRDLKPSRWNPSRRTDKDYLKDLIDSMTVRGFRQEFPIVIDAKGRIGDGHRRHATAKLLGIKRVPCLVSDMDVKEVWMIPTETTKSATPGQYDDAVMKGFPIDKLPKRIQKRVKEFCEIAGRDTYELLVREGYSHTMLSQAKGIATYVGKPSNPEFIKKTVLWLIKYKAQYFVRSAITHRFITPERLLELIDTEARPVV